MNNVSRHDAPWRYRTVESKPRFVTQCLKVHLWNKDKPSYSVCLFKNAWECDHPQDPKDVCWQQRSTLISTRSSNRKVKAYVYACDKTPMSQSASSNSIKTVYFIINPTSCSVTTSRQQVLGLISAFRFSLIGEILVNCLNLRGRRKVVYCTRRECR